MINCTIKYALHIHYTFMQITCEYVRAYVGLHIYIAALCVHCPDCESAHAVARENDPGHMQRHLDYSLWVHVIRDSWHPWLLSSVESTPSSSVFNSTDEQLFSVSILKENVSSPYQDHLPFVINSWNEQATARPISLAFHAYKTDYKNTCLCDKTK